MTRDEMLQAGARGYCTKRNEHKVLDSELIEDIIDEVRKIECISKIDETPER